MHIPTMPDQIPIPSDRVMCHGSNTLWALDEVDENLVEKPVAPGGATGGVEFEAMNYVVSSRETHELASIDVG